jgi:hypothetical protein
MSHDERAKWEALQDAPWEPPASLEAALSKVQGPVIWLSHAVDVMAFGDEGVPVEPEQQIKRRGYIMEIAARRCQASRALCVAAQRGVLSIKGACDRDSDASKKVRRKYFDTPRQLGSEDNTLETDPDRIPAGRPIRARHKHTKWFNVRIETQSLLAWLRGFIHRTSEPLTEPTVGRSQNLSAKGGMTSAIQQAIADIFPGGIPPGMSATLRNEKILGRLKEMPWMESMPDPRTIQRAIKGLSS